MPRSPSKESKKRSSASRCESPDSAPDLSSVDLAGLLRLGHALAGVAFLAGLVGFWIVTGMASRADTVATMRLLLRVSTKAALFFTSTPETMYTNLNWSA